MTPSTMKHFIVEQTKQIASIIDRTLTDETRDRIVGEEVLRRARTSDGRVPAGSVINLALFNDCLTVIEAAIASDGQIRDDEVNHIHPFVSLVARYYARAIPRRYQRYGDAKLDDTVPFLAQHRKDDQLFGGSSDSTRWLGLEICKRSAEVSEGRQPLEQYRDLMLRLMDEITGLGGVTEEERAARESLSQLIGVRSKLADSEKSLEQRIDVRLRAFTDPQAPEVFHPIAHAHEVWERDPYDVETIHGEARATFARLLDRAEDSGDCGRMLLILGESGSGKTHLMRAFRTMAHGDRRGFAGYLQMSTRTDHYGRYVLQKLIDSLERPYDLPEVEDSGLFCISNALVERPGCIDPALLGRIREEELSVEQLARSVSEAADALLSWEGLGGIDIDFLRALIYLQRRDPRIKARVLKYLRGGELTAHDRELIGNIEAKSRDEDPLRLIASLGRAIEATGQGSLVLLVDQLEDVFTLDESVARFRRAMDLLRSITDEVRTSIVAIACMRDFYTQIRGHLTKSVLDRIELDPEPMNLTSQRKLEEIEALVSQRLLHLFDACGAPHIYDEPIFPFQRDQLARLTNLRTRDVLDWCREHQHRSIAAGKLVEPPTAVTLTSPVPAQPIIDLAQEWNDLLTRVGDVPDREEELAVLLAQALSVAADEGAPRLALRASPEGRFVSVSVGADELLVGICNKSPQGGGLGRQIAEVEKEAGNRTPVMVRCSEYPAKAGTQIAKQLGALIAHGARRVVIEETDWRTMLAMIHFREQHGKLDAFEKWRQQERPLLGLKPLRELMMLDGAQPIAVSDERPAETKAEPKKKAERKPATSPVTKLVLGKTRSLTPEVVTLESKTLAMHAAFLGSPGSGKTTVALNIIEQLACAGVPAILVDRKGDLCAYARQELWTKELEHPEHERRRRQLIDQIDVQIFTPGDPHGRSLSIPVIPPGLSQLPAHDQAKVARYAASALGGMMNYRETGTDQTRLGILAKAMELLGQTAPDGAVTLAHIIELLHQQDHGLVNAIGRLDAKHFSKLIDNLETLRITRGELLDAEGESLSADLLFGTGAHAKPGKTRLSVVSTKFLGDNASIEFWISRLIMEIGRWAHENPKSELQALLLFDEADNYMPANRKPATKEPLMDLLRRARSAGVGVLVATQSPGDLDYKCRDNIRTWFVGRVAQKTAIDKMKPLLAECRVNVASRLQNAGTGEFFQIAEGEVVDLKADRSFMRTEQVPEQEILALARQRQR